MIKHICDQCKRECLPSITMSISGEDTVAIINTLFPCPEELKEFCSTNCFWEYMRKYDPDNK